MSTQQTKATDNAAAYVMLFETVPTGSGGRWALGTVILVYLIACNETNGPTAVFATIFAAFYGLLAATCKTSIKNLQIPYIRASNKFDFMCLFLAMWLDALAILAACGAIARTLSTCLDAMTGGLARILILGRNSPTNEPWPDVLGVAVVFLVTGMFMLGLENTKVFSFLMTLGMFGISGILTTMSLLRGTADEWSKDFLVPSGFWSLLTASSLSVFSYPSEMPNFQDWKQLIGFFLVAAVGISHALSAGCLSMIVHYKPDLEYVAVPVFQLLEANNLNKLVPATACLLVLSCSGAFLELFPELCNIIVRLATAEWKILSRQISYESPDSGSPMLAIFIAGSLCAMLAFACPLQNLTHILAASHLCAGLIRAFYLLYSPFRPKFLQQTCETSLSYSRLSTVPTNHPTGRRRSLWNFQKPIQTAIKKSKSKTKNKNNSELEREWLLLGEPSSPRPTISQRDAESTILSDGEPQVSDMEYIAKTENSDSDTSTDIDAIVDEYRQKVKVTTAGPMEKTHRVPSLTSWKITILSIATIALTILVAITGITMSIPVLSISGIVASFIVSLLMSFLPKTAGNATNVHPIISTALFCLGSLLLSACLAYSWPAIVFWILAGLVLFARCDTWCCLCLDRPSSQQIIPSVSGKTATIRIPRPPRGLLVPGRVQGQR